MQSIFTLKKVSFILLLGLFSLTGCSFPSIQINPNTNLEKICAFDMPKGYDVEFIVELDGNPIISLDGPLPSDHIYLIQLPSEMEINLDDLDQPIQVMVNRQQENNKEFVLKERKMVSICGQQVPLMISEDINAENALYRQYTAVFEGKNGPALVNITSTVEHWNQTLVDEFLASIH